MFENKTYETILQDLMDRVTTRVNKTEGEVIWDALAPAAAELQVLYIELDRILAETFADTASREYLIRRAAERGMSPKEATFAELRGVFTPSVPIGARFSLDMLDYIVTEKLGDGDYRVQCETPGVEGNSHLGTLVPIDYIDGLTHAELVEILSPGQSEEDTEVFRQRYFDSLDSEAFGGNIKDYHNKISQMGVGGVKIYPTFQGGYKPSDLIPPSGFPSWFETAEIPDNIKAWLTLVYSAIMEGVVTVGAGTTRIIFINSEFNRPSDVLIEDIQNKIDPVGHQGEGYGTAPIGHVVTVLGADEAAVDVSTHLTYKDGYNWERVKEHLQDTLDAYLAELRKDWEDAEQIVVRVSQIETRFLAVPGILDISDTAINGQQQNLILNAEAIPVRGEIVET